MKKKKGIRIVIVILVIATLVAGGAGFYFYTQMTDMEAKAVAQSVEIENNRRTVYVAKTALVKGTVLTTDNIDQQNIYSGLDISSYLSEDQIGSILIVDLAAGEPVMSNMVTTEVLSADSRWYEINTANIMTTQKEGDCIDVRIAFPDGSDFIVLSKKFISELKLESCIFNAKLNEEEIIRMRSAIIDAYTIKGCTIYTTKYVESNLQQEAIPTYPVKEANISLINSDPNVLTRAESTLNQSARMDLELRISEYADEYVQGIVSGYNENYSKRDNVWQTEKTTTEASQTAATDIDYGSSSD